MEEDTRCGELETAVKPASQDSGGAFGRDVGAGGGIVDIGARVDEVDPGPALVATISQSCFLFPPRRRDDVAVEVMSCGAAVTTAVGDASVGRELESTGFVGGVMTGP